MARLFNGTSDYLQFVDPASGDLDFGATDSGAWAAWFRMEAVGTSYRGIWMKKDSESAANVGWGLYMRDTEILVAIVGDGTDRAMAADSVALVAGQWYHGLAIFDRGSNTIKLYKDGTEVASAGTSLVDGIANPENPTIGSTSLTPLPTWPWNGRIAHTMAWRKGGGNWTAGEIDLLKQSRFGRPVLFNYLVSWHPIGRGSPDADYSGKGYNATVNGTTLVDGPPVGRLVQYDAAGYWAAIAEAVAAGVASRRMMVGVGR